MFFFNRFSLLPGELQAQPASVSRRKGGWAFKAWSAGRRAVLEMGCCGVD